MPDVGHADQDQAVRQHRNDQRADQRTPDRADAADEGGAAQDHGGDGVELVGLAELEAIGGVETCRLHGAAEACEQARHAVDEDQHAPDLDAGEPRRALVAADRVDVDPEHGALEHQPRHQDDQQRDHPEPGNRQDAGNESQGAVADEGIGYRWIEHRGVGAEQARRAAHGGQRPQRDDEGRQAQQRDQPAIENTEDGAGEHRGRQPQRPEIGEFGDDQPGHRRRRQYRADRKVDAAGEDDEGHACGQHCIDRGLLHHDADILAGEEAAVRQDMKADAQQQQHRQHADRANDHPRTLPFRLLRGGKTGRGRGGLGGGGIGGSAVLRHRAAPFRWRVP